MLINRLINHKLGSKFSLGGTNDPHVIAKEPPPEPWQLPKFEPFIIDDYKAHSEPILPPNTNINNLIALFNLFYTNKIIDKLIEWINAYADE